MKRDEKNAGLNVRGEKEDYHIAMKWDASQLAKYDTDSWVDTLWKVSFSIQVSYKYSIDQNEEI